MITEAGDDPKVEGLVYVAAFAPDKGESVSSLIKNPPPGAPVPPILPPQDGFLFLDKAKFAAAFAADANKQKAGFMAASQVPWGVDALNGAVSEPAWKRQTELVSGRQGRQDDPAACAAPHVVARGLDTVPHTLLSIEIKDPAVVHVVQPEDVPNKNWLMLGTISSNQQEFCDALLSKHRWWSFPVSSVLIRGIYSSTPPAPKDCSR